MLRHLRVCVNIVLLSPPLITSVTHLFVFLTINHRLTFRFFVFCCTTTTTVTVSGELHIFQCNSHSAQQVVDELRHWMRKHGSAHVSNDPNSPANVNVKETVHVFNAIAAQRETYVIPVHLHALVSLFWSIP